MFANQRSRFKARGIMVPIQENFVRDHVYNKKDGGEGKLKSISFNLKTEDDGIIKVDLTGFSNPVRVTTKDGVEKYFNEGEVLPDNFEEVYTSFNTLRYNTLVKKGSKIVEEETLYLVGYDFASRLEKEYPKFSKKEITVEIEGEVAYDPYKTQNGGIAMPPKYRLTSFKVVNDKETDTYFSIEAPAIIRKKDLSNVVVTTTEDTISARIPIYSSVYVSSMQTRVYFPQEIVLSSDYIFGKFMRDDDLESKKESFYQLLDGLKESTASSQFIVIKYDAFHVNKQDNNLKDFSIESLSETEQKKLKAMKEKDREKLLNIYKKRRKFIAPFIRKDFIDFLYMSDSGTFFEDIEDTSVIIYDIPVIYDLLKNKASAPAPKSFDNKSETSVDASEYSGLDDMDDDETPKTNSEENPKESPENVSAEDIIREVVNSPENDPEEIEDDDFPF